MPDLAQATADLIADTNYSGFEAFLRSVGAAVSEVRFDSEGVVEILIAWPGGYQILSPRQAHKGQ